MINGFRKFPSYRLFEIKKIKKKKKKNYFLLLLYLFLLFLWKSITTSLLFTSFPKTDEKHCHSNNNVTLVVTKIVTFICLYFVPIQPKNKSQYLFPSLTSIFHIITKYNNVTFCMFKPKKFSF